jgi:serine/threonine-protein kinase
VNAQRWAEIQASFDELVQLNANERASRLATFASSDPELHRALESLLLADAESSAQLASVDAAFLPPPDRQLDPLGLAGRTISHFDLHEVLGAGGMGVVYRADDTRLRRAVALKFLLPHYNLDASAKARFLREAHAAGALDHPNLCSVHEVGTSEEGWLFLAMALYEGETLRARLARDAPMPVREALEIARQIAEGLHAAHSAGIVHRDLKPGNVMLLPDGTVRILDFGLAKARDQSVSDTGIRFGTVSYMSPEQIRGENVDGRSDLWALGVVLYEMVTGRKPFGGDDDVAVVHAILHDGPEPPSTHRSDLSPALEGIVLRLLRKDPIKRQPAAADLLRDLARTQTLADDTTGALRRRWRRIRRQASRALRPVGRRLLVGVPMSARIVLFAAVPIAVLTTSAAILGWRRPAISKPVVRFKLVVDSTEAIARVPSWAGRMALSPDGMRLAYFGGPRSQLLIRSWSKLHATAIPGTEGMFTPFFSPDGKQVGFLVDNKIQIASIGGGPPITVSDTLNGEAGASWGPDGFIYVEGVGDDALLRVRAKAGSKPKWFTVLDTAKGEFDNTWPDALPNGKGVLYTVRFSGRNGVKGSKSHAIAVAEVPSGKHRVIIEDAIYARYASSGHVVYVTADKTLRMVPFDQNSMKVTGEPITLTEGIQAGFFGSADLTISATGTLVYSTGAGQGRQELVWVSRDGKVDTVDPDWSSDFIGFLALSPDGKRVAVTRSANTEKVTIWIKRLDRGKSIKLAGDRGVNAGPAWSPDGRSLTFSVTPLNGPVYLSTQRADGGAPAVVQLRLKENVFNPRWSRDGKWLIFQTDVGAPGAGDIRAIRPGTDTVPTPLVATAFAETSPALSFDGRWLAYCSNESGKTEIYVVPFPNTSAGKWAISKGGGAEPLWSHRGKELFYRDASGNLVAVKVKTDPTFSVGRKTVLFPAAGYTSNPYTPQYAVASDDRRFLMVRPVGSGSPDNIIVVENWFEELKTAASGSGRGARHR